MFNKYMFSYVLLNVGQGKIEHTLGSKEAIDHYSAKSDLYDIIERDFPEADGWEIKSFLLNEEAMEYVSERV